MDPLAGLSGVALTDRGRRAWWSAADPDRPGRSRVHSVADDDAEARREPHHADPTAHLHGYPGRGWVATERGLVLPTVRDDPDLHGPAVFAEPCLLGGAVVAVREQRRDPRRSLVVRRPDGSWSVAWSGTAFVGGLEPSPDGRQLAWLAWDAGEMPWDAARLMVGSLVDGQVRGARVVAGGPGRSAQPAAWTSAATLVTSTEESGRWQPCELSVRDGEVTRRWHHPGEVGIPYWRAGTRSLVATSSGVHALIDGHLWRLDADRVTPVDPHGHWSPWLAGQDRHLLGVRESATAAPALTRVDASTGTVRVVVPGRPHATLSPEPDVIGLGVDGLAAVKVYKPPGTGPWPTVLVVHGGPTLATPTLLDVGLRWLLDAGHAVAVADHTGSAGNGRGFRDALNGRWGDLEVDDCLRAGRALLDRRVGTSIAIRGISAGGWTALHALARHDTPFAAGVAYAPVTDVEAQRHETPDFEKSYVDRLMGPVDRSPIRSAPPRRPVLIVQGEDDEVVRPETTARYVRRARDLGAEVEYLRVVREGHLFSSRSGIEQSRAAELAFYRRELGSSR